MNPRIAVSLYFFANGLQYASWAGRIPDLQDMYHMDNRLMGFILLAHSIGAFITMPITGWLTQLFSSRTVAMVSGIFFSIFFACATLSPNYWMLLASFTLMGVSTGIMDIAMNAQAVEVERSYKRPIMTFFHALFSIGMVAGGLLDSVFISQAIALPTHFGWIAAIAIFMVIIGKAGMIKDLRSEQEEKQSTFRIPRGIVLVLGVITLCCMMGEGAMSDWSTNYMKNIIATPVAYTTFGLTAFAATMTIGRLLGDRARLRYGDYRILAVGGACAIIGMIAVLSALHFAVVIIGFGLIGIGLSNIVPISFSLSGNIKGLSPGVGIAMVSTIGYSGFMVGPPLIGFIADAYNLRIALFILLMLFIMMYFLILKSKSNTNLTSYE
jgi:MFS family permease